ncbi:MAG: hypothetical protein JWM33_3306 [Caulobacteraceae bacterium]|nr:hypothetical protein [Caulobacteraceae bacterium]
MTDQTPPPPITGIVPHLFIKNNRAAEAVDFYKQAFGAVEIQRMKAENSEKLMHAALMINGDYLFIADDFPEFGRGGARDIGGFTLHLQVDDAYAWELRAKDAGCEVKLPVALQFWGDVYGQVRDPFGVDWSIASAKKG